jgi:nanoRNase/pAp phosphatase (c-di-AMP/oligoRNAs hydrolase)
MKTHLIYHRKDADGILSAAIACHFLKLTPDNSTLYGVDHPEPCPIINYSRQGPDLNGNKVMPKDCVVIVDFSYSKLEIQRVTDWVNVTLYDHHQTAIDELAALAPQPHWVLDTTRAACQIVWDELSGRPRPWYVDLIGWRDLGGPWQPNADPVKSWEANVLNTALFNFAPLDPYRLAEHITDDLKWSQWQEAAENLTTANQAAAKAIAQACPLQLAHFADTSEMPIVFNVHPALQSDVCAALMEHHNYPVACTCNRTVDSPYHFTLSFRSTPTGPDVSALAKRLGGGGHPRAAGCTLPSLPIITQG